MSSHEEISQTKISHQAAWVVGCRIVGIACTLASNVLVAWLLDPTGVGVFLLVTSVLAFGCLLALSGLSEAGLRFVSEQLGLQQDIQAGNYLKTSLYWAIGTSLISTGLVVVFLILFQRFSDHQEITPIAIFLVGLGVIVLAWQQLAAQLLRGMNELRSASFYSGGQTGGPLSNLFFVVPLAFAWFYWGSMTTTQVIGLLVASVCLTLPLALWELSRSGRLLFASSDSPEQYSLSNSQKRDLAGVAASLLGIQLLAFVATQADIWIGSWMLSGDDLGFYGVAKRGQLIAIMPLQMALMTIQGTIPRLHAQGRMQELEKRFRSAITWAAIPSLAALGLFMIFPAQVLIAIFGLEFADAAPIVVPLSIGLVVLIFLGSPGDVLSMTGNHRMVLWVNGFSAVALIVLGLLGAYRAGPVGLAIASSSVYAVQNWILWWIVKKRLNIWTHAGRIGWPEK